MAAIKTSVPERVCLVDDDLDVLKSIGRLLNSDGVTAQSFNSPRNFLAYVEDHPVPLVILDVWMDEMNGLEVQTKLLALSPHTRVIMMTGRKDAGTEQAAMQIGAFAFFVKPFDDEQFLRAVHAALAANNV